MPARFPDRLRLPLDFEPTRLSADMANFSRSQWIELSSNRITTATGA
jgi:hypothetical protein